MKNAPFVSVIVPVFNAENTIKKLIQSLLRQTYPPDSYEIILVNNNSNDKSSNIICKYPVIVIDETKVKSSYAARNAGIMHAKGEILAFIDADCIAAQDWIQKGVTAMRNENAFIVGGKINFIFSKKMTASEIYDSITHLDSGSNIKNMRSAATGNLFVKATVFQNLGFFPEVKSGGDMQFTNKAYNAGYKLIYAPEARVFHPTRNFNEMIKKSYRIGTGCIDVLIAQNMEKPKILFEILKYFFPQSLNSIRKKIREKGNKRMEEKIYAVFFVGYIFRIVRGLSMLMNIKRLFFKSNPMTTRDFITTNISG